MIALGSERNGADGKRVPGINVNKLAGNGNKRGMLQIFRIEERWTIVLNKPLDCNCSIFIVANAVEIDKVLLVNHVYLKKTSNHYHLLESFTFPLGNVTPS